MNADLNNGDAELQGDFYMIMEGSVSTKAFGSVYAATNRAKAVNPPTVVHRSYQTADQEAQRLAQTNPGKTFFVLKAHSKYVARLVEKTVL